MCWHTIDDVSGGESVGKVAKGWAKVEAKVEAREVRGGGGEPHPCPHHSHVGSSRSFRWRPFHLGHNGTIIRLRLSNWHFRAQYQLAAVLKWEQDIHLIDSIYVFAFHKTITFFWSFSSLHNGNWFDTNVKKGGQQKYKSKDVILDDLSVSDRKRKSFIFLNDLNIFETTLEMLIFSSLFNVGVR